MKITFLSDTHFSIFDYESINTDMLIHTGDMLGHGTLEELNVFLKEIRKANYKYLIVCPGNHDWICESDFDTCRTLFKINEFILINGGITVAKKKIYSCSYQPIFCNWAFNKDDRKELPHIYEALPENLDILLTHCPPFGILDTVNDGPHLGSKALWNRVDIIKPKIHVFGHIHDSGGRTQKKNDTLFINASILDEQYEVKYKPITLDV